MQAVAPNPSAPSLTEDPRLLAGLAAGCAAGFAAIWAFRGLPVGLGLFWLSPLPVLLAGLGFGGFAAGLSVVVAGLALLLLLPGIAPALVWLAAYGLPALLLVGLGLKRAADGSLQPELSRPLVALGLWPAALTLLAALLAGPDGGLEAALRDTVTRGLARMGAELPAPVIEQIIRLKAVALALWLAVGLVANAAAAQGWLLRQGLALAPAPRWRGARLPAWYPALPALAGLAWMLADPRAELLPLSLCLVLSVPLVLQGLAAMHTRLAGLPARRPLLILLYVLILVFSLPGAVILVALGLLEQFGRKPPANI